MFSFFSNPKRRTSREPSILAFEGMDDKAPLIGFPMTITTLEKGNGIQA
jgi:hypothetical protein